MLLGFPIIVRDSTITTGDNRKTGLTLSIVQLFSLANPPVSLSHAFVTIEEIGEGQYAAFYDAETNGEAMLQVDCTSALANPSDRYLDIAMTRDSSRIQSGVSSTGTVTVGTNNDKTGYALTQAFPANFATLAITVGGSVTAGTVSDKAGYTLAAAGLDQIVVETGINARQALSPILAAAAGKLAGAGTGTVTIAAAGNPGTNRITATTDGSFNRTSVTLVLPT